MKQTSQRLWIVTHDLTAHQSNHEASNYEIFIQAAKGYQIIGPMGEPMVLINWSLLKWRTWKVMGCNSHPNSQSECQERLWNLHPRSDGLQNHNRFLRRNWWHGITPLVERSQVTNHICYVLGWPDGCKRVMAIATMAFIPKVDVVISYRRVKSHLSSHQSCLITRLKQASYGKSSGCCSRWLRSPLGQWVS
jgi:hypothetical protein